MKFEVNEETGEIIGHSTIGYLIQARRTGQLTELTDADLTKVMQAVHAVDIEHATLESYIESVRKTIEPRLAALERRKQDVLTMFGSLMGAAAVAHPDDAGGKTKTTPFGKVSVRAVPGQLSVVNEELAIDHALTYETALVTVSTSYKLDKAAFAKKLKDWPDLADVGLGKSEPSTSITIDTGVTKATVRQETS